MQGGAEWSKDEGKGRVDRENITVVYIHVYIFVTYNLSAYNGALCLGYK